MMHEYIFFYTGDAIFIVDDHQKICGSSSFNFHGSMPQSLRCLLSVVLCMYTLGPIFKLIILFSSFFATSRFTIICFQKYTSDKNTDRLESEKNPLK